MRYRRFGNTDLTVSEVGIGCARIGGVFQASSRQEQLRLLRSALDSGITFYDTADMYAQGESERLLGEAFRNDRHKVIIATKVGYTFPAGARLVARLKPLLKPVLSGLGIRRRQVPRRLSPTVSAQDFSAGYITRMVEGSLARLRSDYLDVYQLHSPPIDVLERGEFVETLEHLKQQGKIRHWGIACERADDALLCLQYPGIASIQVSLSLLHHEALDAAIPRAAAAGLGVIARQVFASGLLARAEDSSVEDPRKAQIATLEQSARLRGRTLAEAAAGFVLAQPGVSVALLGMHHSGHLRASVSYGAAADSTTG